MNNTFKVGQQVINFGQVATIVSFHPVTGDPILEDAQGIKWLASADKCTAVD